MWGPFLFRFCNNILTASDLMFCNGDSAYGVVQCIFVPSVGQFPIVSVVVDNAYPT